MKKKLIFPLSLLAVCVGVLLAQTPANRRPTPTELDQLVGVTNNIQDQFEATITSTAQTVTWLTNAFATPYTVTATNSLMLVDLPGSTNIIDFPAASNYYRRVFEVVTLNTSMARLTNSSQGDTFTDGTNHLNAVFLNINSNRAVRVISVGTNWFVIQR